MPIDVMLVNSKLKLLPMEEFEALLQEKGASSLSPVTYTADNPIEQAVKNHPGLTHEKSGGDSQSLRFMGHD